MFYYSYPNIHGVPAALIPNLVGLKHGLREALMFECRADRVEEITVLVHKFG